MSIKPLGAAALILVAIFFFLMGAPQVAWSQPISNSVDLKQYHAPGLTCGWRHTPMEPAEFYISANKKEKLTSPFILACMKKLEKERFQYVSMPQPIYIWLSIVHTTNLVCKRIRTSGSPDFFQVSFGNWAETGKDDEVGACLSNLEHAPNLVGTEKEKNQEKERQMQNDI